jgi:hypothetical protein
MEFNAFNYENNSDNYSYNGQNISDSDQSSWINAAQITRNVLIPVISIVGLVGNTLSLLVFMSKRMRKSPCSVFQASLAVVDNTFLVGLLVTWIDGECQAFLTIDFACQLLIFITYVTSFLSVWFIVGFTCERFFAIYFPLRRQLMCNARRQKIIVAVLTCIGSALYQFSFWTLEMQQWDDSLKCLFKPEHYRFLNIVVWIDTFVTMVIPFIVITILNTLIVRAVFNCQPRRKEQVPLVSVSRTDTHTSINRRKDDANEGGSGHDEHRDSQRPIIQGLKRNGLKHSRRGLNIRVTKRLLLVSSMFLLLNLPSHIIRLHNLIVSATSNHDTVTPRFFFLQELTLLWYYTTFSCNFFLYIAMGNNFKETLLHLLHCRKSTYSSRREMLLKLRSTRGSQTSRTTLL